MNELQRIERALGAPSTKVQHPDLNLVNQLRAKEMPRLELMFEPKVATPLPTSRSISEHDADLVSSTHSSEVSNIVNAGFGAAVGSVRGVGLSKGLPDFRGNWKESGRGFKSAVADQVLNAGLDGLFGSASNQAFKTEDKETFVIGAESALPIHPGVRKALVAATWLAFRTYNFYENR